MSGQQLERSVLERKERDELHAIAQAMALKPGSRTKKADIIDQILRATGIDVDGARGTANGADQGAPNVPARRARRAVPAAPPAESTENGLWATGSAEAAPRVASDAAAASASGAGPGIAPETAAPATAAPETAGSADLEQLEAPTTSVAEQRAAERQRASQARRAAAIAGRSKPSPEKPSGESSVEAEGADTRSSAAGPGETSRSDESGPSLGGSERSGSSPAGPSEGGGGGAPPGAPGAPGDAGRSRGQQSSQASGNGQFRQGQGQGRQGQGSWDSEGEGANRRGRRRRGRDRGSASGPDRAERDLQSGSAESSYSGEPIPVAGLLDLSDKGYGFLRTSGFLSNPNDVYVSVSQVRRFALRKGDRIEGTSRPASPTESYPALVHVSTVAGMSPEEARQRPRFEDLTPLFPDSRLKLEVPGDPANMTARIVDLLSPIGKGQRGLIVSPPKAGKTTVLKQIAHSIEANNPEVHLMVLLVDERPEEVTDMRRSVKGEVIASTFDRPADEHTAVAELTIERARRLVESGKDVVIVLDGITRLARAYNLAAPTTGRIMSGGVDSGALYPPKKFFGAARNIEEGGSLTILATALVETGSRMDEVIFEEFKGTGNMELRLDRRLAERRVYPAIEVNASSTRHEELLFDRSQLAQVWKLRRVLNALASDGTAAAGLELLMDKIRTTKSNDEFLAEIAKGPTPGI